MFSFHKPKIYRSNLGCCICKAKSSSSRFTDSKKYENEFERCFRIEEKRSGEICNACVLLVKRWKKLSPDSRLTKHWHHVVDARAGPGTKITGNRRITSSSSSSSSSSSHHQHLAAHELSASGGRSQKSGGKSEVLPLSSSQANNQASSSTSGNGTRGRASSLSKARAIDTNVSTFTFGEPPSAYRRSYMSSEPNTSYMSCNSSSSPFAKPQSALSSSAFESVIKRFRQRQVQQQLESQRRQLNRMERLKSRQSSNKTASSTPTTTEAAAATVDAESPLPEPKTTKDQDSLPTTASSTSLTPPTKRIKRASENHGSNGSFEALKISSVLDSSIWRREKICCGVIFRGLFNEVAVFPKLLKPCDYRLMKTGEQSGASCQKNASNDNSTAAANDDTKDLLKKGDEPPPRVTKSGSISSCNSSTSGTGSMEPSLDEIKRSNRHHNEPGPAVRPRSVPNKRRREHKDDIESTSTSGASTLSSGKASSPSGSDNSSSRMMILVNGCDEMEEEEEDELVIAGEEEESSNDASSSAGSLVEMGTKPSAVA